MLESATWIEGSRYFSVDENKILEERDHTLRSNLIQKILSSSNSVGHEMKPNGESPKHSHNCEIDDSELFNWELK